MPVGSHLVTATYSGDSRFLDYQVTLKAPAGKPVVFGDTKEGSMAIRVPLWMTPPHTYSANKQRVKHAGTGTIINADGVKNTAAWGKRSTWVDYHGPKDGKVYGVAIFGVKTFGKTTGKPQMKLAPSEVNEELAVLPFKGREFTRPLAILHRKGRVLTPAMKKFIETLGLDLPEMRNA